MNKGMLGVGIIVMGLIALLMVSLISNYSSGGELDYYLLKETTEASIYDAMDLDFETNYGIPRMDKEKFVESFLRRFAENVDGTRSYNLKFLDLNEVPPKVSVKVDSTTVFEANNQTAAISTQLDQIVETPSLSSSYTKVSLKKQVQ